MESGDPIKVSFGWYLLFELINLVFLGWKKIEEW